MKQSNIKLYRTSSQTQQSRSIRITLDSGFTLIELLVVVAIISLLTTIVLGAISDARVKARNSAKNSLVMEYIKALELYRSDNGGSYPITTATDGLGDPTFECFGYVNEQPCWGDGYFGSIDLRDIMQPYFSGDFAHQDSLIIGTADFKGVLYKCSGDTTCEQYTLTWTLEKQISNCVSGATPENFSIHRRCTYPETN